MSRLRNLVIAATTAFALSATAAAAQASLTNGPNGMQPNRLSSRTQSSGINSNMPSRAVTNGRSSVLRESGANLIHRHRHRRNYRHHYLQR